MSATSRSLVEVHKNNVDWKGLEHLVQAGYPTHLPDDSQVAFALEHADQTQSENWMVVDDAKPDHSDPLRFSKSHPWDVEPQRYTSAGRLSD